MHLQHNYVQSCKRCLMDTSIQDLYFNAEGVCKYCLIHDFLEHAKPVNEQRVNQLIEKIKREGKHNKYDCIVGISGGRDSSYLLYTAVKLGLRPLAVHFDNGWNTETAVANMHKLLRKLGIELETTVADWEEFKTLQKSFLKASVPDADIPTDFAIYSVLYEMASKHNIKYILNGHSFRTEGTVPISWTYMDGKYILDVLRRHSSRNKITSFPILSMSRYVYLSLFKRIKEVRLLEMINYQKAEADAQLTHQFDWHYYGGHHQENNYTKFIQTYYLPVKFNIDKRIVEYSTLIRTGKLSRKEASEKPRQQLSKDDLLNLTLFVLKKLEISSEEFKHIMQAPINSHKQYATYLWIIKLFRVPIKLLAQVKIVPHILYLKYATK